METLRDLILTSKEHDTKKFIYCPFCKSFETLFDISSSTKSTMMNSALNVLISNTSVISFIYRCKNDIGHVFGFNVLLDKSRRQLLFDSFGLDTTENLKAKNEEGEEEDIVPGELEDRELLHCPTCDSSKLHLNTQIFSDEYERQISKYALGLPAFMDVKLHCTCDNDHVFVLHIGTNSYDFNTNTIVLKIIK